MAYLLKAAHAIDPQLHLDDICDVLIEDGKITQIGKDLAAPKDACVIDAAGKYLVPGLVDMHVHFRDPGFEYKETIETGSRAAVHGGFTDVATMPNTNPVTDTGAEIRYQLDHGREVGLVHIRPIGALTKESKGEALAEIGDMVMEGACAFSDDGHGVQSAGMMRTCMEYVSQFNRVVAAHCEVESLSANGVI
ncbi:MAG: amidohydrolase family protein, partial [Lancefieldella rimae]|nr:amidohydrolase family protein [Lancefieldella rimae]